MSYEVKWKMNSLSEFKETSILENVPMFDGRDNVLNKTNHFIFRDEESNAHKMFNDRTVINPMDVTYFVNEYGFRGDWSLTNNKKKVVFIGCSFTFGCGLNYEDTFVNLISNELFPNHEVINLGMVGCSMDTNVRYFKYITDLVEIDSVFFILPFNFRTEIPTGDPILPLVNFVSEIENIPPNYKTNFRSWVDLNTAQYMDYRLGKNISFIESISNHKKIKTYITTYDLGMYNTLDKLISTSQKLPPLIQYELSSRNGNNNLRLGHEFARDGYHPGKYSNRIFSENTIEFIKNEK